MKRTFILTTVLLSMLVLAAPAAAQEKVPAVELADKLRLQLLELHEKEGRLRLRAEQLEEELKPENIERALAGIGSTKPEELREFRRRRLSLEKDSVLAQLDIVQKMRATLELEIANADVRAYQESAAPTPLPTRQTFFAKSLPSIPDALTAFATAVLAMFGGVAVMAYLTRRRV